MLAYRFRILFLTAVSSALQACSHTQHLPDGFVVERKSTPPGAEASHEAYPPPYEGPFAYTDAGHGSRQPANALTNAERRKLLLSLRGFYDNAAAAVVNPEAKPPVLGFIPAIRMIEGATKTVDIEIYEMEDPGFRRALRAAVDRGVQVRIVKDPTPVGNPTACPWFEKSNRESQADRDDCRDLRRLLDDIIAGGGKVVPFEKTEHCYQDSVPDEDRQIRGKEWKKDCYQHGKLIISDGIRALISTGNFNTSSLCNLEQKPSKCNRDFSYITGNRSEIQKLRKVFQHDLVPVRSPLETLALKKTPQITVSPYSLQPILKLIRSARHSIQIQNQYMKYAEVNEAIMDAARKPGMNVELMVGTLCAFARPHPSQYQAVADLFEPLEDAGVKVRMFTPKMLVGGRSGYLHSKAILIDGESPTLARAWVGSVNGSDSAMNKNREFGIIFEDRKSVDQLRKVLRSDFDHPQSQSWYDSFLCKKDGTGTGNTLPGAPADESPPQLMESGS